MSNTSRSPLVRFGKLVREMLEWIRTEEIPLRRELDVLRSYIELERLRLPGRFEVSVVVGSDVDPDVAMVPPIVLQPFAKNAIWHGFSPKKRPGHLLLEVRGGNGALHVIIEKDGVGRPTGSDALRGINKGALRATITRSRLKMIAKEHRRPAGFTYPPIKQCTRVEIVLPLVDQVVSRTRRGPTLGAQ